MLLSPRRHCRDQAVVVVNVEMNQTALLTRDYELRPCADSGPLGHQQRHHWRRTVHSRKTDVANRSGPHERVSIWPRNSRILATLHLSPHRSVSYVTRRPVKNVIVSEINSNYAEKYCRHSDFNTAFRPPVLTLGALAIRQPSNTCSTSLPVQHLGLRPSGLFFSCRPQSGTYFYFIYLILHKKGPLDLLQVTSVQFNSTDLYNDNIHTIDNEKYSIKIHKVTQ